MSITSPEAIEAAKAAMQEVTPPPGVTKADWLAEHGGWALIAGAVAAAAPIIEAQAKGEALAPVLALHKPVEVSYFDGEDDEFSATCCDHCTISQDDDSLVRWPCPTARAAGIGGKDS